MSNFTNVPTQTSNTNSIICPEEFEIDNSGEAIDLIIGGNYLLGNPL